MHLQRVQGREPIRSGDLYEEHDGTAAPHQHLPKLLVVQFLNASAETKKQLQRKGGQR